ncbi:MAG: hypothetical protein ACUVQ1_04685 [Candidatus Kapaibacteriales bacterium]
MIRKSPRTEIFNPMLKFVCSQYNAVLKSMKIIFDDKSVLKNDLELSVYRWISKQKGKVFGEQASSQV